MHIYKLDEWQHHHQFNMENPQGERNTWKVISLTLVMMVIEIIAGLLFGSMALLADGFHMATHTFALGITAIAYYYSRKHSHDPR
ncbi:MAG: cation transporter, partial [Desulfobulbales bacterium]